MYPDVNYSSDLSDSGLLNSCLAVDIFHFPKKSSPASDSRLGDFALSANRATVSSRTLGVVSRGISRSDRYPLSLKIVTISTSTLQGAVTGCASQRLDR
jgi:hypothetical protein